MKSQQDVQSRTFPETDHSRNYAQIAFDYAVEAADPSNGDKHNKWERLAAQRHLDDLVRAESDDCAFYYSEWYANDVCDFVEHFKHIEGAWDSPTIVLEPPQIFMLAVIFGYRRVSDDRRRFTKVYIEMARKGAKSTLTAPVALYCLTNEDELGPQILIGATTGAQALKVFHPARQMAIRNPDFRELYDITVLAKSIVSEENGGFIQTINAKAESQDGHNPHVGILDELHAHKDRALYDVINSAFGARKAPLFWLITTAGYNTNGVCYEVHLLVKKILEGLVDADHFFGIIFTIDEGDDPLDPKVWPKANPLLGITPTIDSMQTYAVEASASPDSMGEFLTKRCNVWTSAKGAWINIEEWKKCNGAVDLDMLKHVPCYGGLDLASTRDVAAFVLAWLLDNKLYLWGRYYVPEACVSYRTTTANVPYQRWVDEGKLIATPGNATDYAFIKRDILDCMDRFNVQDIGFDPWNATQLSGELIDLGVPVTELRQGGKTFNPPMKFLDHKIATQLLAHGGDEPLQWMASNLVARRDVNENLSPDRDNSQEKIDGMVSALMAIERLVFTNEDNPPSPYNDPDFKVHESDGSN